jgi:deoxyadenosine/deoxycytidine kinase
MRIVIDGNIGSGKSTQLDILKAKGFKIYKEPIDDWPLDLFYKDKSRWAFLLHMKILNSFADSQNDRIFERSIISSHHVFWANLRSRGIVTHEEDLVYREWYDRVYWTPSVTIYLCSDPIKCHERISSRQQDGDASITLEYLYEIHERYQRMFMDSHVIHVEGKTTEEIHEEIVSVLMSENAMYISDHYRPQVSEDSDS